MQQRATSQFQLPTKQKFASNFGCFGQNSNWIQLLLGVAFGITLALVLFNRNYSQQSNSPTIAFVLFFAIAGSLAFWSYWALRINLLVNVVGLLLSFIATKIIVVAVLAKAKDSPLSQSDRTTSRSSTFPTRNNSSLKGFRFIFNFGKNKHCWRRFSWRNQFFWITRLNLVENKILNPF